MSLETLGICSDLAAMSRDSEANKNKSVQQNTLCVNIYSN